MHYDDVIAGYMPEAPLPALYAVDRRKLRTFVGGYLEAIHFTDGMSEADGDELAGLDLTIEGKGGWGEGELAKIVADGDRFLCAARDVVARFLGLGDLYVGEQPYSVDWLAHDLWLTRNGHGAGFWDRHFTYGQGGDRVEGLGDALTALVGHGTSFPALDAYRGDDGRAYLA